jgi:hypothetical protein
MKKILFLCDGDNFSRGAFEFIKQMAGNEPVTVKGLFFTPIDINQLIPVSYMPLSEPYVKLKEHEKEVVRKNEKYFISECEAYGIRHQVQSYTKEWNKETLVKESRYADLVIISEELFCCDTFDQQPNYFMEEAIHHAECPVIVVPENFRAVERIAIAYDGKKESMFALRQFANLFPNLMDCPSDIVHIKDDESEEIPDHELLLEYSKAHFEAQYTSKLHFDPKKYFTSWLDNKKNVLLVTGSFSRSGVSNMFRESFATEVISNHSCPIFIAHFCKH